MGVPASFGQEFSKKISKSYESRKKLWKFVYILAKQYRSHFNLTNFLPKSFKIRILQKIYQIDQITIEEKIAKVCLRYCYTVQISLQFDEFFDKIPQSSDLVLFCTLFKSHIFVQILKIRNFDEFWQIM